MSEIVKYAIAGVINTTVGYAVFWIAFHWIGFRPAAANTLAYALALMVSFSLNKIFVFPTTQPVRHAVLRFAAAFFMAFSLNQFVLFLCMHMLLMSAEIAQIFAMASYTVAFYFMSKYFVFVKAKPSK